MKLSLRFPAVVSKDDLGGRNRRRPAGLRKILGLCMLAAVGGSAWPQTQAATTAWSGGTFQVDRRGVIGRSDIVLQRPNVLATQSMPLGNGRLGLAVWAADGLTIQLNRADTLPDRLSPGQVSLPGLSRLTQAADYKGRLDLYDGEFRESGGGMTAAVYVDSGDDVAVVDVTGAAPNVPQTAELQLWAPRKPQVSTQGQAGALAETWIDNTEAGATGRTFGSLAAITAEGRNLRVTATGARSVKLSFLPREDGSFRLLIACPEWHGGDAGMTGATLLGAAKSVPSTEHRQWWHSFWEQAGVMRLSSPDDVAQYFENLRAIDLFTAAAESQGALPGSQAGIGDLFSSVRDEHKWGPSDYWHWNLRMQVDANLGAGLFSLNEPYFRLYRDNLPAILEWTRKHMNGRPGACVPETMRFNGAGYEDESWLHDAPINCGADYHAYYNARTISTGAEVSLWIWRQYEYTDDLSFLRRNYPVMRESARFLLAYATRDAHGILHTNPANAHETQWDVRDPTTDIAAMRTLFPAVIQAATLLHTDAKLAEELRRACSHVPELPLVSAAHPTVLVPSSEHVDDAVIAPSYDPGAPRRNTENIGLEPVWPYNIVGETGPLHAIAVRTFLNRPNQDVDDWSNDPIQAARLGLARQFEASEIALTERYQSYPSGLASFAGPEFYVEQIGVLADALQSALAQENDGVIQIAPAWPADWSADGSVYLDHRDKADIQIHKGKLVTLGIESDSDRVLRIRNPWPGDRVRVVDARSLATVLDSGRAGIVEFHAMRGKNYLVERMDGNAPRLPFQAVSGKAAEIPKSVGSRTIGLAK